MLIMLLMPEIKEKKSGILTIDSEGDGLNQTFWIFDKKEYFKES